MHGRGVTVVLIGLVGAVALSLAVVLAVALPQLRQGSRILTPEGERLTQEAREKVARGGRRAASGTADLVAGALGRIAATLKGRPPTAGTSRHAVQRGAHRDEPNPAIGRPAGGEAPEALEPVEALEPLEPQEVQEAPEGQEVQEVRGAPEVREGLGVQDIVIDLRTPAAEQAAEQAMGPSEEQAADPAAAGPEQNGAEHLEKRFVRTTTESELGLSKGRHAR